MADKLEFLEQLPVFEGLTYDQLEALAAIAHEFEFDAGAVIAYQRDVTNSMYIVRSGRLYAQQVDESGIVRASQQYFPGDYFGDVWLFVPSTHPNTVTAAQDGRLLIINGRDFLAFLTQYPGALANLEPDVDEEGHVLSGFSEAAWNEALKIEGRKDPKSTAVGLLPDELVEYQARRSIWYLFVRLFWPALGFLLLPTITYMLLTRITTTTVSAIPAIIVAVIFLVLILFRLLDWSNDYFVITNKHLIHHEFDLRSFRITVNKIPIKQVQSVEILKPNLVSNLFQIGSARVTTAAQKGIILFDYIDDPVLVQETLNRLTSRVRTMTAGEAQSTMRHSVESHFNAPPPYRPVVDEADDTSQPAFQPTDTSPWARLRKWYAWRVEEGNVITYRKHVFVLLAGVWLPSLIGFVLIGLGFVLGTYTAVNDFWLILIFGFLALFNLGWFIWNFEDWRNDTFQVSDRFVIDIDRKPFGFGESRKQAPIARVQNVNADRPGLMPTLFNYGYVYVETAGVDTDITFEKVPKPSLIQADIFQKLELHEEQERRRRGADRREEYAVLLDVYRQAMEQDRIPRRTPRPGEYAETSDSEV
ncbi:MAG: cyclic nucleotide-binding domain-containing protein [Ardenticatenaceae bacterium]|nr:cyclic nucleotide-binding domain-containing protein [Ardenticatenaceae bacterium]